MTAISIRNDIDGLYRFRVKSVVNFKYMHILSYEKITKYIFYCVHFYNKLKSVHLSIAVCTKVNRFLHGKKLTFCTDSRRNFFGL